MEAALPPLKARKRIGTARAIAQRIISEAEPLNARNRSRITAPRPMTINTLLPVLSPMAEVTILTLPEMNLLEQFYHPAASALRGTHRRGRGQSPEKKTAAS